MVNLFEIYFGMRYGKLKAIKGEKNKEDYKCPVILKSRRYDK